jgi:hypothetical protein
MVFSLTRHEHDFTKPLIDEYMGSHDSFLFIAPIKKSILKHIQHKQNIWGAENVVLFELDKLNYKLLNPCNSIKIIHEHRSGIRNNGTRMNEGDYDGDGNFRIRSLLVKPGLFSDIVFL